MTIIQSVKDPSRDIPPQVLRETAVRKKLVRRVGKDYSQLLRRSVQTLFILLNLLIGLQFFLFVRYFESGGQTLQVSRPPGVEGWLPIAGLMNLKYLFVTRSIPQIHPAAMFLLAAFLLISILFRKAFCSWLCPVGTISELLWNFGRTFLKNKYSLPRWADIPLRAVKYLLLALFVYAVAGMSAGAIQAFLSGPYGLVADVKMFYFFRYLSEGAAITLAVLILLSIFYQNFWCRYLCPYGALVGLGALLSPARICRDPNRCIDCNKCAQACPALLPVDTLITIRSAECTACLECVAVCPAEKALELSLPQKRPLPAWALAVGVSIIFLAVVGFAKWRGVWDSDISKAVYARIFPTIRQLSHP
jgi:polyferredoxin